LGRTIYETTLKALQRAVFAGFSQEIDVDTGVYMSYFRTNNAKSPIRRGFREKFPCRLHHFAAPACERRALD
jgi:hypothetical protein